MLIPNTHHRLPTLPIMGVNVAATDQNEAFSLLDQRFQDRIQTPIAFANMNLLNIARYDSVFRGELTAFVVFNDGLGADIASRIIYGQSFPENLNGTDFIPAYFENSIHSFRVFVFGSRPGLAEKSLSNLARRFPRHRFVGAHTGYFNTDENEGIVQQIRDAKADLLLVGMGNPKQESWLLHHLQATGCKLGFGVGAFIDFSSGYMVRAPRFMRRMRLEWLFRLAMEPRRMFRRYIVEGAFFLVAIFGNRHQRIRKAGKRSSPRL